MSVAEVRDSVATVIKQTRWETVPESRVEIAVSVDSLLRLPEGAVYTRRSGQANVRVATRGDTVYVTGTCDSIERRADYYEAMYRTAREAIETLEAEHQQEQKRLTSPVAVGVVNLAAGLLAGIVLTMIIKKGDKQ